MKNFFIIFLFFASVLVHAQEQNKFGVDFSGFVKSDVFFDTRQTESLREGHFLLYPLDKNMDDNNEDVNANSSFNMLSIQTRLKGAISGPDAFGAKTSAVLEGAFFGHSNGDINGFRLRHAYAKLNWENSELLAGQFWHAMFISECFPGTVSFNTGAPFQPFSRNPQIRFTQNFDVFKLSLTAMSQRDFASTGPNGTSSMYLRNNVFPELNATIKYIKEIVNGGELITGAGINYLSLKPRLISTGDYETDKLTGALSAIAFLKLKTSDVTFKLEGIYGQNTTHLTMLGGYVIKEITDPLRGYESYLPIRILSFWTDIHSNGKDFQVGLFAGYTKNNGAKKDVDGSFFSRGNNIAYVYRMSPRIVFNSGKMRFAGEVEYTAAAYGNVLSDAKVGNAELVGNFRILCALYYFF